MKIVHSFRNEFFTCLFKIQNVQVIQNDVIKCCKMMSPHSNEPATWRNCVSRRHFWKSCYYRSHLHPHLGILLIWQMGDRWQVAEVLLDWNISSGAVIMDIVKYLPTMLKFSVVYFHVLARNIIQLNWFLLLAFSFLPLYLNIFALKLANIKSRKLVSFEDNEINI